MKDKLLNNEEITLARLAEKYSDLDAAWSLFESLRWPKGAVCPHCQADKPYRLVSKTVSARPLRRGLHKCRACRKQFTATVGTILEDSKIPMNKWVMAIFILCASKKAVSSHQLHRMLGITYRAAWFLSHRIRHAFKIEPESRLSGEIEVDETFVGGVQKPCPVTGKRRAKPQVVALVERGGDMRAKVVDRLSHKTIGAFLRDNIAKGSSLNTDGNPRYDTVYLPAVKHESVNHSAGEMIRERADGTKVHVNTCESFFSLLKRGITGSFHHISKEHLPRYCAEFEFRWNTRFLSDGERFNKAVGATVDKRLTYRETVQ